MGPDPVDDHLGQLCFQLPTSINLSALETGKKMKSSRIERIKKDEEDERENFFYPKVPILLILSHPLHP
jgi:hypothetical protein